MTKYFGVWESVAGLWEDFEIDDNAIKDSEVLFASYEYECYSGFAFVLFERDNKLFEIHGGHCSCYGLEGQWEPEETTWGDLTGRDFSIPDIPHREVLEALVKSRQAG